MLTVYMRKDLNMRKGKMAAQSAHAAMKIFLESLFVNGNKLVLESIQEKEFTDFLTNPVVKLKQVKDEEELVNSFDKSLPFSEIVDHGRTEFNGVLTKTCGSQGIFKHLNTHELYVPTDYESGIKAKQIIVFSKENPLSKDLACEMAALGCLKVLFKQMKKNENDKWEIDLSEKNSLSDWITGAFAKIAVSTKTDIELEDLKNKLKENGFIFEEVLSGNNRAIVIEPSSYEKIDPYTKHLSLI